MSLLAMVLVATLLMLFAVRRTGLFSPAGVFAAFATIDLLVLILVNYTEPLSAGLFTAMPWQPFDDVLLEVATTYVVLVAVAAVSVVGLSPRRLTLQDYTRSLVQAIGHKRFDDGLRRFLYLYVILLIVHFVEIDKELVWRNQTYQLLGNPNELGLDPYVGRLFHFALKFIGIGLVSLAVVYSYRRRRGYAAACMIFATYPWILLLAQNSRWAPLYVFVALVTSIMFSRRVILMRHVLLVLALMLTYLKVLLGRKIPDQGVSSIFITMSYVEWELIGQYLAGFLANIFQGAQNFANVLLLGADYSPRYKLLSFSPLISAIDGFSAMRAQDEVRISANAPVNAYAEVWHFGWGYIVVFLLAVVIWLRSVTRLFLSSRSALSFILATLSYWVIFTLSQYSLRTSWRVILLTTVLALLKLRQAEGSAREAVEEDPQVAGRALAQGSNVIDRSP